MSSQSPHRTRKIQVQGNVLFLFLFYLYFFDSEFLCTLVVNPVLTGSCAHALFNSGAVPPREMSPSPTIRSSNRSLKTQSFPMVPSVLQMYSTMNQQNGQQQQQQQQQLQQQGSPTGSQQSKRSPPPVSIQAPIAKLHSPQNTGSNLRVEISPDHTTPPPSAHSLSQSNVYQSGSLPPPPAPPQHSHSQPNIHAHPRPINRVPPPPFLSMEHNWQMTEQLMAEFEQAHGNGPSNPAAGTSGVAYAGGASSSSLSLNRVQSGSPAPKELDRVRAGERMSPKEVDSSGRRQGRGDRDRDSQQRTESPRNRDRPSQQAASPSSQGQQDHNSDHRASPQYHTPMGTPGEHPAASYTQYRRDTYPGMPPRIPTPPSVRKPNTIVPETISVRTTPPAAMNARTPDRDRSLPVQEEPEDDHGHRWANNGCGGRDSRQDHRANSDDDEEDEEDDDETLIERDSEDQRTRGRARDEEEEGFTPRSPTATLPQIDLQSTIFGGQNAVPRQLGQLKHHRTGSTDHLGLRGIDTEMFDNIAKTKDEPRDGGGGRRDDAENQRHYVQEPPHHHQMAPPRYSNTQPTEQYSNYSQIHPPQIPHPEDFQAFMDDEASAVVQAYMNLNSPRPMAPIPPTPHSQTAAPSPMISSIQPSPAPPIGSPYPYPFTHVRRTHAYAPSPIGPSSSYDPNHPAVIQEQLALQMQMYALNNHAPVSESNFSPASTPFQGSVFNPWAFLQASRAFGGRRVDQTQSLRSSPSHEPVALPMPNIRGRGLKKRDRPINVRDQKVRQKKVHPPPRVESTQPRETTPELTSSGEETSTAGEERFEVPEEGRWVNSVVHDDDAGDWIDEDDEGDGDDLLELEYHPNYVNNVEKRRRRWEIRWEALIQAVSRYD